MGIDNAHIEIDNLEVPILDGSGETGWGFSPKPA
jgi:UDP-3-O-acyl-N-acetylglucosamine deacetylase